MALNKRPIYKPMQLQPTSLWQRSPKHTMEKRQPLQKMLLRKLDICMQKKMKLDPCLSPRININSKWIKDLNIRPKTLKQLQETVGNTWEHIGTESGFLNKTQKTQYLRERMNKWDCIKLKSFCTVK
jgi:hypothetical protein